MDPLVLPSVDRPELSVQQDVWLGVSVRLVTSSTRDQEDVSLDRSVKVISGIHIPCPCVFRPSRHNFRDIELKFCIFLQLPYP